MGVGRRVEGAEEGEGLGAGGAGGSLVEDELQAGRLTHVEGTVGEGERTGVRVVEVLGVRSRRVTMPS